MGSGNSRCALGVAILHILLHSWYEPGVTLRLQNYRPWEVLYDKHCQRKCHHDLRGKAKIIGDLVLLVPKVSPTGTALSQRAIHFPRASRAVVSASSDPTHNILLSSKGVPIRIGLCFGKSASLSIDPHLIPMSYLWQPFPFAQLPILSFHNDRSHIARGRLERAQAPPRNIAALKYGRFAGRERYVEIFERNL